MSADHLELLPGCVRHRMAATDATAVLADLAMLVVTRGFAGPGLPAAILERERRYPTGLPTPVPSAIPHADPEHILRQGIAVATLSAPVPFGLMASCGQTIDVELVVMLCISNEAARLNALQQILTRIGDADACRRLVAHGEAASFEAAVVKWLHHES